MKARKSMAPFSLSLRPPEDAEVEHVTAWGRGEVNNNYIIDKK